MSYRVISRKDPEYEQAMREAKALFEAAMAKSAVKGRGRPAGAPAAAAVAAVELDGDAADEVEVTEPVAEVAPVVATPAKPAKAPAKSAKSAAEPKAAKAEAKATPAKRGATTTVATAAPARPVVRRRPRATVEQG